MKSLLEIDDIAVITVKKKIKSGRKSVSSAMMNVEEEEPKLLIR